MPRRKDGPPRPVGTCIDCGRPSDLLLCWSCSSPLSAACGLPGDSPGRMPNDRRRNGSPNMVIGTRGE